jgi:hypothetical protein
MARVYRLEFQKKNYRRKNNGYQDFDPCDPANSSVTIMLAELLTTDNTMETRE